MASHRQSVQHFSSPSPSTLRSGSRFHKSDSLTGASSPVGRRQKCVDSKRYYAQNESGTYIEKLQQDQWETDAASFGYVTDFPALIDPEQRQKSVEPDLPARNQTAKSKKSMTASVGSATNLPALIDLEQRQKSVEPELPARNQTAKPKKKINKQSSTQSRSVPSPNQSNEAPPPPPING